MEIMPTDTRFIDKIADLEKRLYAVETSTQQVVQDWNPQNPSLFSFSSTNTIQVSSDLPVANFFQMGDKVKMEQTTTKYFYITYVDVANNRLVVNGGQTYVFINATITSFSTSKLATPSGHPGVFEYSDDIIVTGSTTSDTLVDLTSIFYGTAYYSMSGNVATLWFFQSTSALPTNISRVIVNTPLKAGSGTEYGILGASILSFGQDVLGERNLTWASTDPTPGVDINIIIGPLGAMGMAEFDSGNWEWIDSIVLVL